MLDFKKNQSLVVSKLGMVAHLRSREESKVVSGCTVSLRPAWPAGNPVSKTEQKNHNCIKILPQKAMGKKDQVGKMLGPVILMAV